jgi:hypothetical protein
MPAIRPTISVPTAVSKAKENVNPPLELTAVAIEDAFTVEVWVTVKVCMRVDVVVVAPVAVDLVEVVLIWVTVPL